MIGSYFVQNSVARSTYRPHVKIQTLETIPRVHTIKFIKINGIFLKMLSMTENYSVQIVWQDLY